MELYTKEQGREAEAPSTKRQKIFFFYDCILVRVLSFYQQQPESATISRLLYELASNYEQIILYITTTTGIPDAMRCEMWQLLCGSKERMKQDGGAQYVVVEKPKP